MIHFLLTFDWHLKYHNMPESYYSMRCVCTNNMLCNTLLYSENRDALVSVVSAKDVAQSERIFRSVSVRIPHIK